MLLFQQKIKIRAALTENMLQQRYGCLHHIRTSEGNHTAHDEEDDGEFWDKMIKEANMNGR